jgi:hypothetical protein
MANMHYFAPDGAYGEAHGGILVDAADWSDDEWDLIVDSPEMHRHKVAALIEQSHGRSPWYFKRA